MKSCFPIISSTFALAIGLAICIPQPAQAATISYGSSVLISDNTNFTVSVFDGKAGYTGLASGTFGDGTVEAYAFAHNTFIPATPGYGDNEIGFYATGGSSITIDSYTGATTFADFDRGDVWTTNDPDSQAANFGGTTETISGGDDVTGTIDISNYTSGTIYLLIGSYDNPIDLSLGFNGEPAVVQTGVIDPGTTRNIYVASFTFEDANKDYTSLIYNYDNNNTGRARFMGVIVDATVIPEPSSALLGLLGSLLLLRRRRC